MTDRRCGTCRHWSPLTDNPSVGDCGVMVGELPDSYQYRDMGEHEGRKCMLWAADMESDVNRVRLEAAEKAVELSPCVRKAVLGSAQETDNDEGE